MVAAASLRDTGPVTQGDSSLQAGVHPFQSASHLQSRVRKAAWRAVLVILGEKAQVKTFLEVLSKCIWGRDKVLP